MQYSSSYHEQVVLEDGAVLELRSIQPSDKTALSDGFRRLSSQSRYRRFFSPKQNLSDKELRYFTECDGTNHYAIVAMLASRTHDVSEGVGVARFVRIADDPTVAELGIVVVDAWQGKGVGRRLLERIVAAAAQRGIDRIRASALAENDQVRGLLAEHTEIVEVDRQDGLLEFSIPVPRPSKSGTLEPVFAVLRLVAHGSIVIPAQLGRVSLQHLFSVGKRDRRVARTRARIR